MEAKVTIAAKEAPELTKKLNEKMGAKEKKPKQPETRKSKRSLPVKFTDTELLQIGKELAEKQEECNNLENAKKQVVAEFTAKIAAAEAQIGVNTHKIRSGYEYRTIEVTEILGTPRPDRKQIIRNDTNEVVGDEPMTPQEMQRELIADEEVQKK